MTVYCVDLLSGRRGTGYETWATIVVEAPTAAEAQKAVEETINECMLDIDCLDWEPDVSALDEPYDPHVEAVREYEGKPEYRIDADGMLEAVC
jgi:hypothetical protein